MKLPIIITILFLSCTSNALAYDQILRTEVTGISGAALTNVKERLQVVQEAMGSHLDDAAIQDFIKTAPTNIEAALQPYGYFKAQVHTHLTQHANVWTSSFHIIPGPLLTITSVAINLTGPGKNDPVIEKFVADFPLKPGQVFLASQYEKAKDLLFQTVNEQGYVKAILIKKEIQINIQKYTAHIILQLETGKRYYFGPVLFNKNALAPEFLGRFNHFADNEPFSSEKLLKFQRDLSNCHYFQQVDVNPDLTQVIDNKVPINVNVTVPKSQRYSVGVGYGTFTGPRLTLAADWRRVTNTGQHFNVEMKLSSVLSGITAKYFIPGKNPLTDQYVLGANIQKFSPKNGNSFSQTLSASYVKGFQDWQTTTSLSYLMERFSIHPQPTRSSNLLIPNFSIAHLKADDLLYPRFGRSLNFTLQGAAEKVLSTTSFIQSEIKGKYIFSPTLDSRVILRGDLGYTVVDDLHKLPLTLQFVAGGLNTVRGFPLDTLGPGRYLRVASIEYQHKIIGNWNGAIFYDIGNASNNFTGPLNRGDGIGIIYKSLLGPAKFYVGRAETKPGKPFNFEFSIGSDF